MMPSDPNARGADARRPHEISADSTARLREAVRRSAALPVVPADDPPLRDAIAALVAEARQRGMRPEELIPVFKSLLDSLPEMHGAAAARLAESRFRERLVTLCIKAYYEA